MHQGQGGLERIVAQVGEVGRHLLWREHALVDDGAAGEGADVEVLGALDRLAHHAGGVLAQHEELALVVVLGLDVGVLLDEDLLHRRLGVQGGLAQAFAAGGDDSPAQHVLAEFLEGALEDLLDLGVRALVQRKEAHAHGVLAGFGQVDPDLGAFLQEESMGQLRQDAGAVAGLLLGSARTAVIQIDQDLDALLHDVVGFDVLQVRNETDTAGVVFEPGIVQTFPGL